MKCPIKFEIISIFFLCLSLNLYSQNKTDNSLYDWFDDNVGNKNLGINNGTLHINYLKSINTTHRYFGQDQFRLGNLIYDNQTYTNVNLKYDILKDVLIAKIDGQSNSLGINLIKDKTEEFSIDGKRFINLNFQNSTQPQFVKGYYEIFPVDNNLELYIKYHKDAVEILKTDGVYYRFEIATTFLIRNNDNYYEINDQKDLIAILPKYANEINEFYLMSRDSKKSDEIQFMKNLMKYLNNYFTKNRKVSQ